MAAWSGLCRNAGQVLFRNNPFLVHQIVKNETTIRLMSGHHARTFPLGPSRWMWHKFKDLLHLYVCITAIPTLIAITYINIFIGSAQLTPIPEGYIPKHWEYEKHPISRFMARYMYTSEQQEYEKNLHALWVDSEVMKLRELENKINELIRKRVDYQHLYYEPYTNAKYIRKAAQCEKDENVFYSSTFEE